ncbi:MAG: glycosyltransferase family 9 protein [Phycisphaerae bacterium]
MADGLSILAVHPGALGDLILFGHLLKRIEGEKTIVTSKEKGKLLLGLGVVSRAIDFDALPMHEIFADKQLDKCALPGLLGRHDRLVSCFGTGDRRAELRLAAACGAEDAAFLPIRPPEGSSAHLLAIWCDMLGLRFGFPDDLTAPSWKVPSAWRVQAACALNEAGVDRSGSPCAVIHPGSGGAAKCWPLDKFVDLASRLTRGAFAATSPGPSGNPQSEIRNPQRLFVLGPAEIDRWDAVEVGSLKRRFPVLADPPLTTLAGVLAGARLYVGNDSGVSHLAAAVGAPTVAIFGPTRAENFAPIGPHVRTVSADRLKQLSVAEVFAACKEMIRSHTFARRHGP